MDFTLTEDHQALRDVLRRCCDGEFAAHERGLPEAPALAAQRHAALAEMGVYGLTLPAQHGGSALGAVEAMFVAQELGRALAGPTWLACAALSAPPIGEAASPAQQDRWLRAIAQGELMVALACEEPHSRWDLLNPRSTAHRDAGGLWRLDGSKCGVLAGDAASLLLVTAQAPEGLTLFAVEADAAGVQRQPYRMFDGRGAAHLLLTDVAAEPVGSPGAAATPLMRAWEHGCAMQVADTVGAAEALLELLTEHLQTRQQFGRPLATQQVIQHRLADHVIALEQLTSMALVAALSLQDPDHRSRTRGVSAASALAAQLGRRLALDAIQLHGAMGMTEECAAARYAKRLLANGVLLGDAHWHRQRLISLHAT